MSVRIVRLDDEAESTLAALRQRTGLSLSEVLQRSLRVYAAAEAESPTEPPYEIYRRLDLGAGGYAIAPAAHAKTAVEQAIRKKYGR